MTLHEREGEAAPSDQLLTCKQVCHLFGGINAATLYRGCAAGRYPRPIKVGPNTSRWLRSEVEAALAGMIAGRTA